MIGTLVTWSNVPGGALVRGERSGAWYVRIGDRGWCVHEASGMTWCAYAHWTDGTRDDAGWSWEPGGAALMRIAAIGLTGDESAESLCCFADVIEQRFPWEGDQ